MVPFVNGMPKRAYICVFTNVSKGFRCDTKRDVVKLMLLNFSMDCRRVAADKYYAACMLAA